MPSRVAPAPLPPLPLREKNLQCHNCNMRVYWSFAHDRYEHTYSKGRQCEPGTSDRVAHPRIR